MHPVNRYDLTVMQTRIKTSDGAGGRGIIAHADGSMDIEFRMGWGAWGTIECGSKLSILVGSPEHINELLTAVDGIERAQELVR